MHVVCFILEVLASSKSEMHVLMPRACHIATESRSRPICQHVPERQEVKDGRGQCMQWLGHRLSGSLGEPTKGDTADVGGSIEIAISPANGTVKR